MNYQYCHNCGSQLPLGSKFCTQCGTSQASLGATPPQPPQAKPQVVTTFRPMIGRKRDDGEDDIFQDKIETISELGISFAEKDKFGLEEISEQPIQRGKPRPGQTLESNWQEGGAGIGVAYRRDALNIPIDPRTVIAEFKQEAGGTPTVTLAGNVPPESRTHSAKGGE